ncbi:uncharacterized protein LOC131860266 [Cryptomeria japonica]|uniref:uncharacterized protein LOC131860266 n=1 Tax=Cryptomeria japonica TaxID=3369 RepID=UPI0027DA5FE5|nr:uncharacterized protein LOC131860266 [Cryptomeria japonica]
MAGSAWESVASARGAAGAGDGGRLPGGATGAWKGCTGGVASGLHGQRRGGLLGKAAMSAAAGRHEGGREIWALVPVPVTVAGASDGGRSSGVGGSLEKGVVGCRYSGRASAELQSGQGKIDNVQVTDNTPSTVIDTAPSGEATCAKEDAKRYTLGEDKEEKEKETIPSVDSPIKLLGLL